MLFTKRQLQTAKWKNTKIHMSSFFLSRFLETSKSNKNLILMNDAFAVFQVM